MEHVLQALYYFGEAGVKKYLYDKEPVYCLGSGKFSYEFLESQSYLNVAAIITNQSVKQYHQHGKHKIIDLAQIGELPENSKILILTTSEELISNVRMRRKDLSFINIPLNAPRMLAINTTAEELKILHSHKDILKIFTESNHNIFIHRGDPSQLTQIICSFLCERNTVNFDEPRFTTTIIAQKNLGLFNEIPVFTNKYFSHLFDETINTEHPFLTIYRYMIWPNPNTLEFRKVLSIFNEQYSDEQVDFTRISEEDFISFFTSHPFGLPLDLLRKWARVSVISDLKHHLSCKSKDKGDECVYIFRSWFKEYPKLLDHMYSTLNSLPNVKVRMFRYLKENEAKFLQERTRGGFWEDYGIEGGGPYVLAHFNFDRPLDIQLLKEEMREKCRIESGKYCNPIHSSDDYIEARQMLLALEEATQCM